MSRIAFTYGTLLSEKVLMVVIGRVPERVDASLNGYSRAPVRGQCYPAVYKTNGCTTVKGKALLGLSEKELEILDDFEDPAYDRMFVAVETVDGRTVNARVWARPEENVDDLVQGVDWDYERFQEEDEEEYVKRCSKWAARNSLRAL